MTLLFVIDLMNYRKLKIKDRGRGWPKFGKSLSSVKGSSEVFYMVQLTQKLLSAFDSC